MSWVFLQPSDVWFFRDGKPFSAGSENNAGTIFPPTPFTIQGAFRSLLLGVSGVGWKEFYQQETSASQELGRIIGYPALNNRKASLGKFQIRGPFLARLNNSQPESLIALPTDALFVEKADEHNEYWQTSLPDATFISDNWTNWGDNISLYPLRSQNPLPEDKPKQKNGLLTLSAMQSYLQGESFQIIKDDLFEREGRLGIALDYNYRRPYERMIYQTEFIRPNIDPNNPNYQCGLLVQLGSEIHMPHSSGIMAFGGESRTAFYTTFSDEQAWKQFLFPVPFPTKRLKVCLLTPSWFSGGWQPKNGDWTTLFKHPTKVKLISVALGKPQSLGGWDIAKNQGVGGHKEMRAFIPAGSTYYFESDEPIVPPTAFTETPNNELPFDAQGFGAYISGEWQWLKNN